MVNVDSSPSSTATTSLCGVHVTRRLALIGGIVFVFLLTTIYLLLDASMASARAHSLATNHTYLFNLTIPKRIVFLTCVFVCLFF